MLDKIRDIYTLGANMASTLLIVQFVLAVIIIIAILLQKSSGGGLGGYSGSNETMFGAKGPAGFLVKFTFIIGLLFVVNTVALGYLYNQDSQSSIVDNIDTSALVPTAPTKEAPVAQAIPSK